MLTGLPQMCPSVSTVLDRPLALHLTGPGGGEWILRPGDPQLVIEQDGQDAAAVAESSAVDFVLWGTTRVPWRERPLPFRKGVVSRTPPLPALSR